MEGKMLYGLFALVACATAASISGTASIDPSQASLGGQIIFPSIPGINAPLFGGVSSNSTGNSTSDGNSTKYNNSPFGPFEPFLRLIPGLNLLLPRGRSLGSPFPNIDDLISRIPGINNGNRTSGNNTIQLPQFHIPGLNQGSYIPGVSEALNSARRHIMASLNITSDFSTGLRDAVQTALNSNDPAGGMRIILDTIAKVYSTVAANCPFIVVGSRVFGEGIRLAGEVARSIGNVAVGPEVNPAAVPSVSSI